MANKADMDAFYYILLEIWQGIIDKNYNLPRLQPHK